MNLCDKYRPTNINDFVLPHEHQISTALDFVANPRPSAWLLHGKSGTGKTSLARLMAQAAAQHTLSIRSLVGPDLDSSSVRDFAQTCIQPPLFGKLNAFVVNEADSVPLGGQIRLLEVLENLGHSVWIFTSNEELDKFEPRFLSRLITQSFGTQGLFEPAVARLLTIAETEHIKLTRPAAQRIVRQCKSNLRAVLQTLETMRAPSANLSVLKVASIPSAKNPDETFQKGALNLPLSPAR